MGALMQADANDLTSLNWLQDLPQRIQHHRQQQQRQLHGTQQESEPQDVEEAEDQAEGMQAQVLLLSLVHWLSSCCSGTSLCCVPTVKVMGWCLLYSMVTASLWVYIMHIVCSQAQQHEVQTGDRVRRAFWIVVASYKRKI